MTIAEFFAAAISAVVEFGAAETTSGCRMFRFQRLHLLVADVIAVRVAQEHDVDRAKTRVVRPVTDCPASYRMRTPVGSSKIVARSRMQSSPHATERRDLHVLAPRERAANRQRQPADELQRS